jgi:hypothetical protein
MLMGHVGDPKDLAIFTEENAWAGACLDADDYSPLERCVLRF